MFGQPAPSEPIKLEVSHIDAIARTGITQELAAVCALNCIQHGDLVTFCHNVNYRHAQAQYAPVEGGDVSLQIGAAVALARQVVDISFVHQCVEGCGFTGLHRREETPHGRLVAFELVGHGSMPSIADGGGV